MKAKADNSIKPRKWTKTFLVLAGIGFISYLISGLPVASNGINQIHSINFALFALISSSLARLIDRKIYVNWAILSIIALAFTWIAFKLMEPSPGSGLGGIGFIFAPVVFLIIGAPLLVTPSVFIRFDKIGKNASNTFSIKVMKMVMLFYSLAVFSTFFILFISFLYTKL